VTAQHDQEVEMADLERASSWNEATPDSEFARVLPRQPFERWIVAGFWLLIVAVLAARIVFPTS
jgi:hypothetical protein